MNHSLAFICYDLKTKFFWNYEFLAKFFVGSITTVLTVSIQTNVSAGSLSGHETGWPLEGPMGIHIRFPRISYGLLLSRGM